MKKLFVLIIFIAIANISFAQKANEVRASMGIDFVSVPSLKDYLEANYTDLLGTFNSAVNFSGSYGRMISQNDQLEAELSYLLNSYNSSTINGTYDLTYSIIMPSVLYYYVLTGKGYNFKFGGGGGVRFLSVTEKLPADPTDYKYSSMGYGLIISVAGNTALAENVYAYINVQTRYDSIKEPEPNQDTNSIGNVSFNSFSFGVRLGISYQF